MSEERHSLFQNALLRKVRFNAFPQNKPFHTSDLALPHTPSVRSRLSHAANPRGTYSTCLSNHAALHDLYAAQKILDDKESQRQELNQQVHLLAKKLHNLSRLREKNCITAAQYWERRNPLERELTDVKNTISKAATNHPLLRTLAQTKQLAEHYTYLKPLTEFDEYEFKFAVNRVLVDSESCTFELKNGMKFKEIF